MTLKGTNNKEEDYYRQIVNLANVAIVKFDMNLNVTDFIGNAMEIFGYTKEEITGRNLFDTIVPLEESTGRDLKKLISNIIRNIGSYEYNVNENMTREGRRIWMQWYNSEIRDDRNEVTGILSIGVNITDRINTEIALKESEDRFKKLSNLSFNGIVIHDGGVILDCNQTFQKQTGYTREELIGMQLLDKLVPEKYHEMMYRKLESGSARYEAEAMNKAGRVFPIMVESRNIRMGGRKVRAASIRDISRLRDTINERDSYRNRLHEIVREKAEEIRIQNDVLQFERNQLRTIIDTIPDAIYIKDRESRFLNANLRTVHRLRKKKIENIIGKTDFDFFERKYAEEYFSDEQEIIRSGLPLIDKEELSFNEKGEQIYVSTTKVPLKDNHGKIIGIIGINRDITAKKLAEKNLQERKDELEAALEQLKEAQAHLIQSEKLASLGVLLAGIAHEINNPVNFISAGVNSIIKDFEDIKSIIDGVKGLEEEIQADSGVLKKFRVLKKEREFDIAYRAIPETLQDIRLGAARIREIIRGLNRFSRPAAEDWKKANLHEELDNVLILLKNKYKNRIEIIRKYDESLPLVECFPGKLNQVFMNILNNAIDTVTDDNGTITITSLVSSNMVEFSIRDTGQGIRNEDIPRVFDPFYTTKEAGFGLGLGLAISYSIVEEHGGEIKVESEIGQGTEFIIRIPLKQKGK